MSGWTVYWIISLDAIEGTLLLFAIVLSVVAAIALLVACTADGHDTRIKGKKILTKLAPLAIFFILATALVPTTKQMAAIYLIPPIANNERIQDIGDKSLQLLQIKMNQWLDDMKGKKASGGE